MNNSVLVTGAGTGLGREIACFLAARGYAVYATIPDCSQREPLEAEAARRGVRLEILQLDVTDRGSIEAAVRAVLERCGGIYGVVNNAALSLRGYFEDLDDDEIRKLFDVNLFGAMEVTRAVLPHMRAAGRGRLIFIGSVGGRIGSMARTAYCASKFAIEGYAESLMQEVVPLGIQVSIVEPGIIKTERWTVNRGVARRATDPRGSYYAWFRREEALADALVRSSPTRPQDVARAVDRALAARRPRLRYVVGRRAALVLALRRYIPGEIFERLYWGEAMRRVTGARPASAALRIGATAVSLHGICLSTPKSIASMYAMYRITRALGIGATIRSSQARRLSNKTIRGFYSSRVIMALLDVGLFDELAAQQTVDLEAFAASRNLDLPILSSLCDYLVALKILKQDGPCYALDSKGSIIERSLRGAFTITAGYEPVFHELEALLRKQKTYGVDIVRDGELVAVGSGEIGKLLAFPMVAELVKREGFKCVLDLGCGDGTLLRDLCGRVDGLQGYGIDLSPEGVAAGQRTNEQQHMDHVVHLMVGDMFNLEDVTGRIGTIDVATCVYVLHEFLTDSKERTLELLRKFKGTFPGARLVICEVIKHSPAELRLKPGGVADIQLFHAVSNQNLFSREEWKAVFAEAGFAIVQEDYLSPVRTAIYMVS